MKYQVITAVPIMGGDISREYKWLFNSRGEAEMFVATFKFLITTRTLDDPYLVGEHDGSEIKEIDDTTPDPYKWLFEHVRKK